MEERLNKLPLQGLLSFLFAVITVLLFVNDNYKESVLDLLYMKTTMR